MGMSEEARRAVATLLDASKEERREAVRVLLASIDQPEGPMLYEKEWLAEVARRRAEGRPTIDGKQVMDEARAKLAEMAKAREAKGR